MAWMCVGGRCGCVRGVYGGGGGMTLDQDLLECDRDRQTRGGGGGQ